MGIAAETAAATPDASTQSKLREGATRLRRGYGVAGRIELRLRER